MDTMVRGVNGRSVSMTIVGALLLTVGSAAAQHDTLPREPAAAYRLYDVDVALEKWFDGPVEYVALSHEHDVWKKLETDDERRQFIDWFWNRRDLDSRDQDYPFRDEFYKRVAYANNRFKGFPRGWRSDRGRIWIILGPPSGGMRRVALRGYGRCSAESGESWTYYVQNMAFNSSMGEFTIVFVEERIGQYRICDPVMMGTGGWPQGVSRALEFTNEAVVVDTANEFEPGRSSADREALTRIVDVVGTVESLSVPIQRWGADGVAGAVLIPLEVPLRDLLFEPSGETLTATLGVDATMIAMGDQQGHTGQQRWTLELDDAAASTIGGASLRTALVLAGDPGGYSVRVRVMEPLSGTAWVWDGAAEVSATGRAASPLLVGRSLIRLREGGEVGVLAPDVVTLPPGETFVVLSWVRGFVPDAERVQVRLIDSGGESHAVTGQALWGNASAAGPLIFQGLLPDLPTGMYTLRLSIADDLEPVLTRVKVQ